MSACFEMLRADGWVTDSKDREGHNGQFEIQPLIFFKNLNFHAMLISNLLIIDRFVLKIHLTLLKFKFLLRKLVQH